MGRKRRTGKDWLVVFSSLEEPSYLGQPPPPTLTLDDTADTPRLTAARAPIASHLDIIKFICKDLFLHVYGKQIDNLRTNHRGVFVLQSHAFPPLAGLSSFRGAAADLEAARVHLVFPQALIQGALARLGMVATVTAESAQLPQCRSSRETWLTRRHFPDPHRQALDWGCEPAASAVRWRAPDADAAVARRRIAMSSVTIPTLLYHCNGIPVQWNTCIAPSAAATYTIKHQLLLARLLSYNLCFTA